MSADGKGYAIPDNYLPAGFRCLSVIIPDEDYYLYAFGGAYEFFTKWVAWERDDLKRGKDVANLWLQAYNMTMQSYWDKGFIMSCEQIDQLVASLDSIAAAINNQSLSVVNNVSVSGGCCQTNNQWRLPENWQDDWNDSPVPDTTSPHTGIDSYVCDSAHSAFYEIGLWFQQFAENVGNESPYQDLVEEIDEFGLSNPYTGWLYTVMSLVTAIQYDNMLADIDVYWQSVKDDFICHLINSPSADEMKAWLLAKIRAENGFQIGFYMETLLTGTYFNPIFDGSYVPFPQFVGSDCSNCGSQLPVWAGLTFVPFQSMTITEEVDCTGSLSSNEVSFVSLGLGGGARLQVSMPLPSASGTFVGFYLEGFGVMSGTAQYIYDKFPRDSWGILNLALDDKIGVIKSGGQSQNVNNFFATCNRQVLAAFADYDWRIGSTQQNTSTCAVRGWFVFED